MIQETCPLCGGAPSAEVGQKDGLRIFRCADCTAQFSEYAPELSILPSLYDHGYFNGSPIGYDSYLAGESLHRRRAQQYLADLSAYDSPGALLDVGCATGFFLDEARRGGWQVRGCEVSEWAAGQARTRFDLDVIGSSFPTPLLGTQQYDAVTFLNVFEHLPDPRGAELAARALVKPGGVVALETWDADAMIARVAGMKWHQYRPADTPIYLNRRSLARLFNPEHWTLIEYRARTKWITLAHGLHALGLGAHAGDNGDAPRHGFMERIGRVALPYRLGDLVWAVLRRNPHAG
jgi:2-polyprenyl-3-methyl-5-hydroxy-6-metoxy-1,4-benzoquinol methylase